jgi:hypothetical protein
LISGGVLSFSILSSSYSLCFDFELLFALLLGLPLFVLLLALHFFLLLDDLIILFLALLSSSCASWGFGFKLQTLCFFLLIDSSRGRLRNQVVSILV